VTVNPCTLCAPLGAALASAGVRGALPLLHGAQGCATYIRRYLISHFREPMDIASSSLGESQTVFGGEENLGRALDNVVSQYGPSLVTVATTCLAETIGEDVSLYLRRWNERQAAKLPLVPVATPSYRDGHVEGFHAMVYALVQALASERGPRRRAVNVLPPLLSPADLRHLRDWISGFGLCATILPDYADRLDGPVAERYDPLPEGGTPLADIAAMPRSLATLDFTSPGTAPRSSQLLTERGVPAHVLPLPIGVRACDRLRDTLGAVSEQPTPAWLDAERGRLLDAYADGHKYVFDLRVALYGDPELVVALAGFLREIGARPCLCATGARNRALSTALGELPPESTGEILEDTDFDRIEDACRRCQPEVLIGNSKGYRLARALGVPLVRVGFPIHDRLGAGRLLHVGYRGTAWLFDTLVNTMLEHRQQASPIGFSYL
jgi:nitrogenase molybdenum-iron protein NifN